MSTNIESPFRLDGEIALVTGGGTGLGLGMARCLRAAGAKVVITGRRADPLDLAVAKLGNGVFAVPHDVTDLAAAPDLVARAAKLAGGAPTILVNNAGIHLKKPALETGDDEFNAVIQTHVSAAFALTRAAAPGMIAQGRGSVIFISSMTAFMGMSLVVAYSAAKSAVTGLVMTLSGELSPQGVRVNAIAPGWIDSPMLRKAIDADPERKRKIIGRIQMEGFGHPDDIGWAAVFLSSPAARYITGQILPVDGGGTSGF
jgi:gluconate 5-dehydrogenase